MNEDNLTEGLNSMLRDQSDKPKRGRPATSTRNIIKSSQEGVKENETRATFIVKDECLEKLKAIAYWERTSLKNVINKALEEYINKVKVKPRPEDAGRMNLETSQGFITVKDKPQPYTNFRPLPIIIEGIRFFTVMETARTLHVTSQTVRAYIKQGKLKGQRIGRPILISESNLLRFLQINTK